MPEDASDLDALVRRVDPDRWLSSRFIGDPVARADVVALYAFDHELARAPKVASNALIGEIRLTWWSEVLDELFEDRHVRHHPTAQALADVVRRRGLARRPLDRMIDARERELDPRPMTAEEAQAWALATGGAVAALAAAILDPTADEDAARALGGAWSLGRLAAGGRVEADAVRPLIAEGLAQGRRARWSPEAFPAVAHAVLAAGAPRSELAARLRLTWAVARGRV
jgi:phytoene synthase